MFTINERVETRMRQRRQEADVARIAAATRPARTGRFGRRRRDDPASGG